MQCFIIVLFFAALFFLASYIILLNKKSNEAKENAKRIDAILTESFTYSEKILNFAGKKIANHDNYNDLKFIHKTFLESAYAQGNNDIFSWTMFDWVNRQNLQTVNTMFGINTTNPPLMNSRQYLRSGKEEFFNLKFSDPTFGTPSGIYIIPIGMAIGKQLDGEKGLSYIGNISAGLNIQKLNNKILQTIGKNDRFIIINSDDYKFVFGSFDPTNMRDSKALNTYSKQAEELARDLSLPNNGILSTKIVVESNRYLYSQTMAQHPYIILTGYNQKEFWQEAISNSFLFFLQLFAIAILFDLAIKRLILYQR